MPRLQGLLPKIHTPEQLQGASRLYQIRTFIRRNYLRKIADRQYVVLILLEAPLLAFILGFLSKYTVDSHYTFSDNKKLPRVPFHGWVVALSRTDG